VAASDREGNPWRPCLNYSTHGDPQIVVAAPGGDIWGTAVERQTGRPGERYTYRWSDGTTFSAAYVAAASALWLEHHEAALAVRYREPWQRVEAFRHCVAQSARPFRNPPSKRLYGAGVLDVRALLDWPLPRADTLRRPPG
jgi:hypothetical protein